MLKGLQKFLTGLLVIAGGFYLLYQAFLYNQARDLLPPGTIVAGVDVGGLSLSEAADLLTNRYMAPILIYHRQEQIQLSPQDVGFSLDLDAMLRQTEASKAQEAFWQGYVEFMLNRSFAPVEIGLRATHDRPALTERLEMIARLLDKPAKPPLLFVEASTTFDEGEGGFTTDVAASLPDVEAALYRLDHREAHLVVEDQPAPTFDMNLLNDAIQRQLDSFDGLGSIFIMDLQTGDELSINGDVAISGLSILKIAIFVEAYRALNAPPDVYQEELLQGTAVRSSNYDANLLLHVVAGQDNTYRGADILTESMRRLGLVNTFMAVPYDANPPAYRQTTYPTPANSRTDVLVQPDPSRQTTAEDIGTLLSMIYYCAKGGGALLAVYPGQVTSEECQAILDVMALNFEGNLVRLGIPKDVMVSHKHGWDGTTYGDAGIVFSPGGDYVIVEYLTQPGIDWLVYDLVYPVLGEISRTVYNYFNFDQPNLQTATDRAQEDQAAFDAAAAAEAEAEGIATATPEAESATPGASIGETEP